MEVTCANRLCGKKFRWCGGLAHFQRAKEHFCCRSCQNTIHGLAGTPQHKIWERVKKRANEDGTPFSLSIHDIPAIPERCPVLGIKLKANVEAGPIDSSPSLDRLIPSLGYVPGNIRVISNRANRLRSDSTAAELRLLSDDAERIECRNL